MSVLGDLGVAGYSSEPATAADLDEAYAVAEAELSEAFGFCPWTVEDARAVLEPPDGSLSLHRLVRDREGGAAVQWWSGLRLPGDPVFYARINSHPRLGRAAGDELARAGWETLLDWIREVAPREQGEVRVHSGCPATGEVQHRRLEAAGFRHERTFWEMTGRVTEEAREPAPVVGLTIEATRDGRAVHDVLTEGFAGHWGFEPMPYDEWLTVERSSAGYDPDWWRLARIDGAPAGVMIMTRRAQEEGALYVAELATLPAYRRRGVAAALLAHAFDVAADHHLEQVSLHVDSQNSHDAPSVYRRAGLEVRTAFHAFTRSLSV